MALKDAHDIGLLRAFVHRGSNHAVMNKWYAKFFMYLVSYLILCLNIFSTMPYTWVVDLFYLQSPSLRRNDVK